MAEQAAAVIRFPDGTTIRDRLRLARVTSGRSRYELARAIGVSLRTYERIENGERELRLSELQRLAEATGQDIAFFGATSLDPEDEATDSRRTGPHPLSDVKPENGDDDEVES